MSSSFELEMVGRKNVYSWSLSGVPREFMMPARLTMSDLLCKAGHNQIIAANDGESNINMSQQKLIVFDLDGVLVETKNLHFETLNRALQEVDATANISQAEHLSKFDGLDTQTKLELLVRQGRLDSNAVDRVWERKQELTLAALQGQDANPEIREVFVILKRSEFVTAVASNSIRATVNAEIERLGISDLVDIILSNEDVVQPKPHPEIYWRAMILAKSGPEHTTILEDSNVGRRAALASGAELIPIDSPSDVTTQFAEEVLLAITTRPRKSVWKAKNLKILIPMAGAGSRFAAAGYTFPKPLIEIQRKPMIEVVVKNLAIRGDFIFLVQKEHFETYSLGSFLSLLAPGCEIVIVENLTDGAARTALLAEDLIDNDTPLLIANSDQFVDWDSSEILYQLGSEGIDGGLITFESTHPKWSFAKTNDEGWVTEVAEKNPISNMATTGIYFWSKGSDFVKYAKQMIQKDIRTNGEFYIAPVYNEAIADGLKIRARSVKQMWGLGTPEDLDTFLNDPIAVQKLREL